VYGSNFRRDVVDHVSWTGSVKKMLLGSILDDVDEDEDAVSPTPARNLEELCQEFCTNHSNPSITIDDLCDAFSTKNDSDEYIPTRAANVRPGVSRAASTLSIISNRHSLPGFRRKSGPKLSIPG
jgi:hypothetical protein